jgi:hypothetical protein
VYRESTGASLVFAGIISVSRFNPLYRWSLIIPSGNTFSADFSENVMRIYSHHDHAVSYIIMNTIVAIIIVPVVVTITCAHGERLRC